MREVWGHFSSVTPKPAREPCVCRPRRQGAGRAGLCPRWLAAQMHGRALQGAAHTREAASSNCRADGTSDGIYPPGGLLEENMET